MSAARRRTPVLAALAVCLLVLAASCSDTGLSGQVTTTTTKPSDSSTTTSPGPTAPDTGSTGGGSTGGGTSGGSSGGSSGGTSGGGAAANTPQGFLVYQDASTPSALWTVDADGGNRKQLPTIDGQVLSSPLLSRSGNELAFLATPVTPPGATAPPGPPKLWVSTSKGADAKPLTADPVADTCFTWSPDGNTLLSTTTDPATGKGAARSLAIDGKTPPAPVAVDLPAGACPIYLDQDTLAFVSSAPALAGGPAPRNDRVATARPDGKPTTLTATLPNCTLADLRGVPTSGVISVSATCDDPARSGIYLVVLADGQDPNPQLIFPGASGPIAFSPDGGWLAYTRVSDPKDPATAEILVTKLDGSNARRLVAPTTSAPTWQATNGGGGAASNA